MGQLQCDGTPAGAQDAAHLGQAAWQIDDVAQQKAARDAIERGIRNIRG
jgi:diketogulonate reductase-like aldo/keto reductase